MKTQNFKGRDFLTLLDYTPEEVQTILDVALNLKMKRLLGESHKILDSKTLFMIFFNQSLRTRNSFEAGMTQLGGHAHYLDPSKIYTPAVEGREIAYTTERVSDVARTLSRMGDGIAIRCYGDPVDWVYGDAHLLMRDFAKWADIPIINMECDKYHPCQGLADVLTVQEKFGTLKKVKYTMAWAYSPSVHKPLAVPQSAILAPAMLGADVTLAHPKGLELDDEVLAAAEQYAKETGGSFRVSNDFEEALEGAQVVYPKAWTSKHNIPPINATAELEKTQALFDANKHWICDQAKMELAASDAIYMHCLPADRSYEVTDEVIDGPQSVVFDEAENRLHVQKAVMSLVMQ